MSRATDAHQSDAEFAILGAGAIGSILGAHLAQAGHSVTMIARGQRVRQIQADGLRITGLREFSTPARALCDTAQLRHAEILIVAIKTPDTALALEKLRHVDICATFSLQNGLQKNELLANVFGMQHVLGGLADISGEKLTSGEIVFTRNVNVLLGEISGQSSSRAQQIAKMIDASGVRASASESISSLEWSKFAAWVGLMALSVTIRAMTWSYLIDPGSALLLVRLVREIGLLAQASGIELTDRCVLPVATLCSGTEDGAVHALIRVGHQFELNARTHRMSSLQDLEAGRALEIHETVGYALQKAAQRKVAMPLMQAFYYLISAIDRIRS